MDTELKKLSERVDRVEDALRRKAGDAAVAVTIESLKRKIENLEERVDDLLDATIKAVTTQSPGGLKALKMKRH